MLNYAPNSFMGINYNSPTIQNMMQQQQSYSTVSNIGGLGYNQSNPYLQYTNSPQYNQMMNGGYYSGYYGNYNPLEIRRQMEEQRKREEQEIQNHINIQKMKSSIFANFNGEELDEDYDRFLQEYYNPYTYVEINKDLNEYEEMRRLSAMSYDPGRMMNNNAVISNIAAISNQIRALHPVDQSFVDYLNTAGDIYRDALINEHARQLRQNIANTYNREAYNQLANLHNQTSSFASLRQNVSVDDLSISLPDHLKRGQEYQERKNQFLAYITQNDARNRGVI